MRFFLSIILLLQIIQLALPIKERHDRKIYARRLRRYSCLPKQLQQVPLAEDSGVLLAVRNITIPGYPYSYNPSIVQGNDGFHLAFRFDIKSSALPYGRKFSSYIGMTTLDKNFHPKGYATILDTSSEFSEDPRCTYVGDDCYLVFNDCSNYSSTKDFRSMRVAQIDLSQYKLQTIHNLDIQMQPLEKNWIPFAAQDEERSKLFLSYTINPHKVFKLFHLDTTLEHLSLHQLSWIDNPWEKNWGQLRGGTPAILVDDEYLAFFHSRFVDRETKLAWYVMGAYTFASAPPFQLTSISPYPILFQGIYQTTVRNTEASHLRCIYPSGIVLAKEEDKEVIYLACGENDRAIKIVTFDKKKLLEGLVRINQTSRDGIVHEND